MTSARSLSPRPRQAHEVHRALGRLAQDDVQRVRRLQRRDDPLQPRDVAHRVERLVVGDRDVARAARCRAARRARARRPGSRGRRRSSAPRRSGPRPSAAAAMSAPWRTPGRPPTVSGAPWRPLSRPSPAASTPSSATSGSSMNAAKVPIAFEPPPTQATTRSGSRPSRVEDLRARLVADHPLQLAHDRRVRRRADGRADDVVGRRDVRHPVADRLGGRLLERAGARRRPARTSAPSSSMRCTLGRWRRMSSSPM